MRLGVILSMKKGINLFTYRELAVFSRSGIALELFPTKCQPGLYNPQKGWKVHPWRIFSVLCSQPFYLLRHPGLYLRGLVEAARMGALVDFALAWSFARALRRVDLLYATFADHKLYIGYFAKQILHKPLVVTIHAYELYQNPNPRLFRKALDACDQIVTVTEYNKELLTGKFGIAPQRVEVVRISVDLEDYRPEDKFILLIVAFFAERKGHEILFRAVQQLGLKNLEVWVVGDEGAETAVDVRAQAEKLGIASQVAFFGPLAGNALKAVYRMCDVFCLPCHTDSQGVGEGFPTVLAEAMAFEKPIISTTHVEIPRILPEILVAENDVDGLAQAILRAYRSSELRRRLGAENRKLAERYFSTRNPEQMVQILSRLALTGGEREERAPVTSYP